MLTPLEFEKPILELEARIADLRQLAENDGLDIAEETCRFELWIDKSFI
jgi:acetyl-CoA carboxylase alpha subunit